MKEIVEIDVLMAVYNGERYLEEQILSIYKQTIKPKRLIVSDDCSSDGSHELLISLKKYWPDWLLLSSPERRLGCKANFGRLVQFSNSPYIAFADQDDIWDLEKLEKSYMLCSQEEKLKGSNYPILVHSDLRLIREDGSLISQSFFDFQNLNPQRTSLDDLLIQNVVTGSTTLINKSLLNIAIPIPSELFYHDMWLALVASRFGAILFISESLVSYRQHDSNLIGASRQQLFYIISRLKEVLEYIPWKRIAMYYYQAKLFYSRFGGELPLIIKYQRVNIYRRILILLSGRLRKHCAWKQIPFILLLFFRLPFGMK